MKIKDVEAIFPLSPVQEEMLLNASSNGSATTNCSQVVFDLRGELDVSRFERAWKEQIDLHSILRSSFAWKRVKQPVQLINKSLNFAVAEEDWRELSGFEQQSRLEEFLVSDRERGFDPAVPPLIRVTLFRTQNNLWALVLSYHSILFDAQSLPSILRNVFTAYDGMNNGDVGRLAAIRPHKDYVSWMKDQKPSESRAYWQRLFENFDTPSQISLADPQSDGPRHEEGFDKYTRELASVVNLDAWARENGLRVQTVIEAAWSILLSRYGGQRDVVFGLTFSGRPDSLRGDGALVGAFTNTIPLRLKIKPDTDALSFLREVERLHHDAQHFEYTSTSRILEWTNLDAGIPLFDTCLNFDNHIVDQCASIQSKSLALQNFRLIEKTPSPLNINVQLGSSLIVEAVYSTKKFDSEMIGQMLRHLENLIAGIMDHPERALSAVEMLSEEERRLLLEEWNETAVAYPRERSVAELFEEVAVRHADAIAVEYEGARLSYEQLNARANQLAHYLRSKGVGPEVAVGIMLDRSLELIVGLVAVLKAGGAYVPLDPQYPQQRLTFMLADSGATTIVTQSKYAQVIPDSTAQLVVIDHLSDEIAAESEQNLVPSASGSNLAYIIYTSGSTGQPKGVSVEQRAVTRLVRGANYVELGPEEVLLQYAPVSFDASTFEVWGALLNGGKLVVMRAGDVTLRDLGRTLTEQSVTTLWLTSALFHQMMDEELGSLAGVRQLIAGGDVLSPAHVNKVLQLQLRGAVINGYGPTENTTFSTCEVMSGESVEGRGVPIGLPISNSTAYVLNERMEPVPVGVRAELYVGGEGLARGYAGRADQTAERFVPHPYAKQPGERLYRTGDEVRRRRDGKLEFIGRTDQQVKVRGFRIEPGEIERVLAQHTAVEEAAVVMKQSQAGDKRLVGYVVLSGGQEIGGDVNWELREHVRRELPEYMVPAAVMVLERMPVTANGKLDRAALPEPTHGQDDKALVGPRTAEEELLLEIWKQLLGVEQISIHDDFFELGGHSLLATQVMARIRQVFQVELGLQVLFEEPTIAGLSNAIQSQLRQGQVGVKPELKRAERGAVVELSYAQQRLWFSEQMGEGSTFYNVPVGLRLRGELDVRALARTLQEIVRRHESLRTRIELIGTQPYQVIDEQVELSLPVIDHSELDQQSKAAAGERVKREEASAGFNLSTGPVMRAKLIKLGAEDHLLLVTMHHIVSDGWSMGVLVKEVSALYEAYRRGEESPLAELPVQYADYALWQREWLQGEVLEEQLRYWEEKLAGAPALVDLPTDRARGALRAGRDRARQLRVEFDEELTRSVKQESRKQALTVYMLLMGAIGVLLTRYSRSREVVIGSPIANRVMAEVEGLIGFFVNTLALRVRVDEEETVEELLKRVREEVLGAYAHQDVPYEKVVERVQLERAGEAGELFQVMVAVQNAPRGEIRMEGLEIEAEGVRNERAKFELTIAIGEEGGRLVGGVEYNAELYEAESVQRMMRHLEELLRGVVAGGEKRVRELEMMSAAERRQALDEWNETAVAYPHESSVAELFEEIVVNHAQAVAVEYEGEQLSYEQLNARANQLAHYLRSKGVGPEVAVGIMLDRSLELIVGLVAILKAGGAYVPLDPQYPQPRLTFMLDDSNATVVITDSKYAQVIPGSTAELVLIDKDSERIAAESEQDLPPSASGLNLAYITYTSGSTGQPKGVSVEQRAVARLVRSANYVELGPEEVILQFGPVSFDASTFEVWGALLNGGKLVVMRAGEVTLRELGRTLTQHAVTTVFLTSALFHQMVDEEAESLAVLKQVITGGDVISPTHIDKALAHQHEGAVISAYGPTENTTFSTCEVMRGKRPDGRRVPLGLPISNSTAYVLNERMEPVPVGVTAELYLGGEGLARCYAGRADQTAERFVPHPYAKQPGERLYRTGDEVIRRSDGKLEFIGRTDQQVKVRGFRIELAEIERVLAQHPAVEEAAVVMKQSQTGDKRLVGYVVLSAGLEIGGDVNRELREHVRSALPEYMVPAAVMMLERMPVTANGKLDRAALPELDESQMGAAEYEQPRTPVEEVLAGIWAELLDKESVSIHDDFFDLGGHSLLVMRLNAWIRDAFGVEVTVGELFASPTLTGMAAIIDQRLGSGQRLQMPSLERVVDHQTAPLSYAQQRLWFLQNLHPEDTSYNMPFGLKLKGKLDVSALNKAFSEIVRRHETLRTRFLAEDGGAIQVVQPAREWPLPLVDLTGLGESQQQAETKALIRREAGRRFDLASDESLHTVLLRRSAEDHLLLVTMHHIVSDGWSMGVLVKEVSTLYDAYHRGEESPLAEPPVQYADYAVWQREWLQGEVLEEQLKYWEEKLAGAPVLLDLPTDRARGAVRAGGGRAGQVRLEFDEELTRSVKQESRKQALTVYMLLMGALGVLLTRYSRSREVVIGSPIANRAVTEVEGLIGFFVNTLALRMRVDDEETVEDLLKRVREEVLGAYAHRDVPYEKVVERVKVERAGEAAELFQVMVAVQNTPKGEIRMEGLEIAAESVGNERAKFEMTIGLGDDGGRLVGGVEYNADLYEAESVERMMRHLEELLRGVVAGEGKRVRELEMMSAAERRQVLEEWNETAVAYPRERSVAELFEEVVVNHSQAVAVEYEGEQLSYEQLNARANQLAHYLRSRGVEPEVAVGIMLDRSLELIVGLLGILKAGGAYVPLDPQYPEPRLTFMLADSKATTVITQSKYAQVISDSSARLVVIDEHSDQIAVQSEQDLAPSASGLNLAYITYTSGSTGQPKGVSVEHRAIVRLVRGANYAELGPQQVMLQYAPVSFDASTFDIWGALLNGGKLVVMKAGEVTLRELGRTITERGVNTLFLTSALFHQMVDEEGESLAVLKQVITGGDVISPTHIDKALAHQHEGVVVSAYGPTENTTFSTCEVMRGRRPDGRRVPLGLPISNSTAYVLNEHMEPVPVGVTAELYVGGEGLARCYAGRADQTAERFVPHPYAEQPGERLYRTGDEVRRRRDGKLEFIGRRDQQVKVRGFRIELGEIQRVLAQHAAVEEAVVVVKQGQTDDKRLVAYVVLSGGQEIGGDVNLELREHVRRALPEYMVPAGVMVLERMPVTANGKLDRAALPEPDEDRDDTALIGPRTVEEELILDMWKQLLKVEKISIDDDFFTLGGHSLLATRVMARIRQVFQVELELQVLFEEPTIAALSSAIQSRLRQGQVSAKPELKRAERGAVVELSYAQQRLWFSEQMGEGSTFYNVPVALRLRGELDVYALGRTLQEIVRRHESLRTRIELIGTQPYQVIDEQVELSLPVIDHSELDEESNAAAGERLKREEASAGFNLSTGPVMRAKLIKQGAEDHLLLVTMHHIVSDGWSMGVLIREVSALYEAYHRGEESPLAELPVQYADYALWQREWLQGEVLEEQLKYWEEKLAGAPAMIDLPTDRPRAAFKAGGGKAGQLRVEFDEELTRQVKQESRKQALTVYMLLMGAVGVLLTRYSRSHEVVIGGPIANRVVAEVEDLIGFFVNTLALRVRVDEEETVEELLKRVREEVLGAYAHQDVPYEKVVERVKVERAGESGLFQVMLVMQNAPRGEIRMEGLEIAAESVGNERAKFEMSIGIGEEGGRLVGGVEYNAELYEAESVQRMMRHLEELLRGVVAGGEKRVRELEMMSAAERRQVLEEWNDTAIEYPSGKTISELFEEVAFNHAQSIAVEYEGEQLGYEQLNRRANQLALYLRSRGVGPEVAVGIMLDRSLELIVGLIAILKAGGAYVPLDPQYPQQRLSFMLDDSRAGLVITQSKYAQVIEGSTAELVLIDEHSRQIAAQSEQDLPQSASGSNLAYIIYTSGSTGQPKGVAIEHHNAVAFINWSRREFTDQEMSAVLASTSVCFDLSVFEIFATLGRGGKVVVVKDVLELAGGEVEAVSLINTVPSAMRQLLELKAVPESVEVVNLAGEVLSRKLVEEVYATGAVRRVLNLYGPTEDTTYSTGEEVSRGAREVMIGAVLENKRLYILDERMEAVAIGVRGEIYLGGEGQARGYVGRPEQTAARFVPDPFSRRGGERLYRTGDEGRLREGGRVEYLGRRDEQVKVRGYRIELGEIEATLSRHPGIAECVIVLKEKRQGDPRIAAYFVPKAGQALNVSELRTFLKVRLPGYMIPAAFVAMDAMPLTPNGKIDRNALPEPVVWTEHVGLDDGAPRSPIEEMLVQVWKEVLEVENIRINDNFFDMGGHSLLATLLTTRLRQLFELEFPLQSIFAAPTIAEMAAVIEQMMSGGPSQQAPPIVRVPRDTMLPLSFAQERLWFINQLEPGNPFYNIPVAMSLSGPLDVAVLWRGIREIVARHEALRTTFVSFDGEPVQVISPSIDLPLPILDISNLDESQRASETLRLVNQEALLPFDLSRGPLIRVSLIRVAAEEQVFLLTMHHIISDAWSMRVFIQELKHLYSTFSAGQPSSLPDLSVQYADFAHWQRQHVQGEVLEGHLDFWRRHLAGTPALIDLPLDRERPPFQTFHGAKHPFALSKELSASIKKLCREEDVTLFMALLAAYNVLLYSYKPQDDIVVGTDMAIRNRPEIEPLIGFFVNLIPVRTEFRGNPSYRQLLAKVREATLGANLHQEIPFDKLIEELQPERDPSYAPLVQVLFVLENVPIPVMEISGVSLKPLDVESKASKFDLVMIHQEIGQNIIGTLMYNTDLFDASTIEEMIDRYKRLLSLITEQRDTQVSDLQFGDEEQVADLAPDFEDFLKAQPTIVSLSEESLINTGYLAPDSTLPLVISPAVSGLDLAEWAESNHDYIDQELLKHGGILFRGFEIDDVTKFERVALAICSELFNEYGDLPRDSVGGKVYTSTPYPAGESIYMHNESSQMHQWPLKICFHCITPADEGGETPIVDCRKIYEALPPDLRARFADKKLMYVRNFTPGIDVSWQQFFRTEDKNEVERYCREAGIEFEWKGDDELQTRSICPAIAIHPKTNEMVFFNQIQAHHVSCLDPAVRQSLQTIFTDEGMPRNVRFGDGSQIDDEIVDYIRALYTETSISFAWQKGDILLLDNMLTAHGRNPFTGQRKIVVAMGEMISDEQTQPQGLGMAANTQGQAGD